MGIASFGRKDRLLKRKRRDAYLNLSKLPEPTVCEKCGAVFSNGRWTWKEAPDNANISKCPACKRCEENYPAGSVKLSGIFYRAHKDEIANLIQNIEKQEKNERPLERIMTIKESRHTKLITTTGIHIARRIGEALSRAYKGDYTFNYLDGEDYIEVTWRR